MKLTVKFIISTLIVLMSFSSLAQTMLVPPSTHPAVAYLMDHGIEVQVVYRSLPTFPGEPTFHQKVQAFWEQLELAKDSVVSRSEFIDTITLTSYTNARIRNRRLSIDVDHTQESMERFFQLFDKNVNLVQNVNLEFDMGINLHDTEDDAFVEFETLLDYWLGNMDKVNNLSSVIDKIEIDGTSSFMSLEYGNIYLSETGYQKEFEDLYTKISKLSETLSFAAPQSVDIEVNFNIDNPDHVQQLEALSDILAQNKDHLKTILESERIQDLTLSYFQDENRYYRSSGKLRLSERSTDLDEVLQALSAETELSNALTATVETSADRLDSRYLESVAQLQRLSPFLMGKKDALETLRMNYRAGSRFSRGTLFLNPEDADADLQAIIEAI